MSKKMFAIATAAILATPAVAQMTPGDPTQYVKEAGASDLFERQEAQLMLHSTQNREIREFAQKMIHDHSESTQMVKAAAMKAGMHPAAPMLSPAQKTQYEQLKKASGKTRDTMYIHQQLPAHQQALSLHQYYENHGTSQPLKQAATKIVPVVENHISILKTLTARMG